MKDSKPILSIITITCNDPVGINRTFSSLEKFYSKISVFDWEHIVVANAYKNENMLVPNKPEWPIRKFIFDRPLGIYRAMNTGILECKGEWIIFLNGGDELFDEELLVKILTEFKSKVDYKVLTLGARLLRDEKYLYDRMPRSSFLFSILGTNSICHQAMIYHRSVFEKIGDFNLTYLIAADYEHHWKIWLNKIPVECRKLNLVNFDMSGTSNKWDLTLREFFQVQVGLKKDIPFWCLSLSVVVWGIEFFRFFLFRLLKTLPGHEWLQKRWYQLRRLI